MELSDVKAGLSQAVSVLGVIEDMALDIHPNGSPASLGQIANLQAMLSVLLPFVKTVAADLDKFPDDIKAEEA